MPDERGWRQVGLGVQGNRKLVTPAQVLFVHISQASIYSMECQMKIESRTTNCTGQTLGKFPSYISSRSRIPKFNNIVAYLHSRN
ncbi:hypothetical protein BDV36DRAFT_250896 [Aspergillus pseudocaelatus]|uniref:Uncharacterized protein n=1 Tax=Aspergillus pseudocaelatus TaxID=1825620 RepID=A0ABQ6WRT9_9EURO|nr:hypothetical protein BDV36DRAFT_250896 [Aspergillus pseudocaelatus]